MSQFEVAGLGKAVFTMERTGAAAASGGRARKRHPTSAAALKQPRAPAILMAERGSKEAPMGMTIGTKAPDFRDLPGTDGRKYSLDSFREKPVLVVIFSCNHCPVAQAYEDRITTLQAEFGPKGAQVVCINSNDETEYPEDSFDEMKRRAKEKGFNFHYLRDGTQGTARAYLAERTPHVHVFDAERKLRYTGKIDDNMEHPERVKTHFLKNAVEALLAGGAPPESQTFAIGCTIKWRKP